MNEDFNRYKCFNISCFKIGSIPYQTYYKATSMPNHGMICEQSIDEMRRIFNRNFPNKEESLNRFLAQALLTIELIHVPIEEYSEEALIRDVDDRSILRAAIKSNADILLTGDKDFLESDVRNPIIMTAADFIEFEQ